MLSRCNFLEYLCIKIRGIYVDAKVFQYIELFLPNTIKILKLKPTLEENAIALVNKLGASGNFSATEEFSIPVSPASYGPALLCLSLVLDVISDRQLSSSSSRAGS
ncbi:hypothetical protein RCOM_0364200 [Ricinus communis]|uniref:F-box/LRR-repeat protein 15-like leucin rich repeat domain-containing protein n=1 Tax=Ricinus communis TaxID=3988 RepID=B9ST90_RICCO|nr:hypothetical protein RCOM_0364200 [Ricinus communis]